MTHCMDYMAYQISRTLLISSVNYTAAFLYNYIHCNVSILAPTCTQIMFSYVHYIIFIVAFHTFTPMFT